MFPNSKTLWTRFVLTFLTAGILGLSLMPLAYGASRSDEKPTGLHPADIKKVQEALRDKGHYTGQVDGVLGPQTRVAIRAYESRHRMPVDGAISNDLLSTMGLR